MKLSDYLRTLTFDLEFSRGKHKHQLLMDDYDFYKSEIDTFFARFDDFVTYEYSNVDLEKDHTSQQFHEMLSNDVFLDGLVYLVFVVTTGIDDGVYYDDVHLLITSSTEDINIEHDTDVDLM